MSKLLFVFVLVLWFWFVWTETQAALDDLKLAM